MSERKIKKHELPLIPLRGLSVFPYMVLHFDVGRENQLTHWNRPWLMIRLFFNHAKEAETDFLRWMIFIR